MEIRTEKKVINAAPKSKRECKASERIPKLPVSNPTVSFRLVSVMPTSTE